MFGSKEGWRTIGVYSSILPRNSRRLMSFRVGMRGSGGGSRASSGLLLLSKVAPGGACSGAAVMSMSMSGSSRGASVSSSIGSWEKGSGSCVDAGGLGEVMVSGG